MGERNGIRAVLERVRCRLTESPHHFEGVCHLSGVAAPEILFVSVVQVPNEFAFHDTLRPMKRCSTLYLSFGCDRREPLASQAVLARVLATIRPRHHLGGDSSILQVFFPMQQFMCLAAGSPISACIFASLRPIKEVTDDIFEPPRP